MQVSKTKVEVQVKKGQANLSLDDLLEELERLWQQLDQEGKTQPAPHSTQHHLDIPVVALAFVIGSVVTLIILYILSTGFGLRFI